MSNEKREEDEKVHEKENKEAVGRKLKQHLTTTAKKMRRKSERKKKTKLAAKYQTKAILPLI